jgi:V/A-type H+-transporting ATPase subunit D
VRFEQRANDTRAELDRLLSGAERSALRAALVAGEDRLRLPADAAPAVVDIEWAALIGARFPSAARTRLPQESAHRRVPASASVVLAELAYRDLLVAAVEHAVAAGAARVVDDEVATTRFRLRAIEDREAVRLRWAAAGKPAGRESREAGR